MLYLALQPHIGPEGNYCVWPPATAPPLNIAPPLLPPCASMPVLQVVRWVILCHGFVLVRVRVTQARALTTQPFLVLRLRVCGALCSWYSRVASWAARGRRRRRRGGCAIRRGFGRAQVLPGCIPVPTQHNFGLLDGRVTLSVPATKERALGEGSGGGGGTQDISARRSPCHPPRRSRPPSASQVGGAAPC